MVKNLLTAFQEALRPVPDLTIWEWSDLNRILTSESSAEKGQWNTERVPYMFQIFEDLSPNSPVEEVIVCKGSQLGFTEAAVNVMGAFADIDPCPILYVHATLTDAKRISQKRLTPMIKNCVSLSKKIRPARERDSQNNILSKAFPGGSIELVGSESAAALASQSIRVIIFDETDRYPLNVGGEGSPIALGEARTTTYPNRKVFKLSTPTIEGSSAIQHELDTTEWNEYHVPCPHCAAYQTFIFSQFRWEKGKPKTVKYECIHCGELIEERHKTVMMARGVGKWVPRFPHKITVERKGYWLPSYYSPYGWLYWHQIIAKYEKALAQEAEDPSLMITFVNTIMAETTKQKGDSPPFENIYNRRENYAFNKPPLPVCFLTAGIDVQKDRIEVEIVGWCKFKETYSIDYRVLLGDNDQDAVWNQLTEVLNEHWEREDGAMLPLLMSCIDSGYNTTKVYDFCNRFDQTKLIPVKGQDHQKVILSSPKAVNVNKAGKRAGTVKLWNIGVSLLKSEIYSLLKLNPTEDEEGKTIYPPGYCHFPQYSEEHFKRLTNEKLKFKMVNGLSKPYWDSENKRNEQLDCRVYARAAAAYLQIDRFKEEDYTMISNAYLGRTNNPAPEKKSKDSSFWNGRRN
jgi:phage terminase large subunit GpA-like protein